MGYPYHELIPPAILLDHPGLTKREYIKALDETHGSGYTKFTLEDPWDSHNNQEQDFHQGSKGLAEILNLEDSAEFVAFQTPSIDEHGLAIESPRLGYTWRDDSPFELKVHVRNKVGQTTVIETSSDLRRSGVYLEEEVDGFDDALILGVLGEELIKPRSRRMEPYYRYQLRVLPVTRVVREENYPSEEALWEKWPQFHSDNRHDFTQARGHFRLSHDFSGENYFRWILRDGRYFLDPDTFDLIPASWRASDWECMGYVDLIATAEAIKHQAWKLLSRRGLDHFDDFLRDFPDSKVRIEEATRNAHMALASKRYQETVSHLLRTRLFPQ